MILIMGPSGAGKSSQAAMLANDNPDYIDIELGRALRQSQDPEIIQALKSGELVDDSLVVEIIRQALADLPPGKKAVLDGFPRRLNQVHQLDEIAREIKQPIARVIVLNVSQETVNKRLGYRGRQDDVKEAISRKWQVYQQDTRAVIEHYRQQGLVTEIDGEGDIASVHQQIKGIISGGN